MILNQEVFNAMLPEYQKIIERLAAKYKVVDGSYLSANNL
jgi:TRAP-type C4-dicarboxylate transport system substrate-binding protein